MNSSSIKVCNEDSSFWDNYEKKLEDGLSNDNLHLCVYSKETKHESSRGNDPKGKFRKTAYF
jgi:hypothetical protein